jgi:hypothetical protein
LSLASQIRDKLDAGVLPRVLPERMWTAYGQGACDGCSEPIHPQQIEWQFMRGSNGVFRLHTGCLGMWQAELRRRGRDDDGSGGSTAGTVERAG